jgi:hypothetical protein
VAALAVLSPAEPDLSLSPHQLDAAPLDLIAESYVIPEQASEPLMMAQPVPHQTADKRRVKVYELRHNDWFDRGTGFCCACLVQVSNPRPLSNTACLSASVPLLTHVTSAVVFRLKKASRKNPA